MVPGWRRWPTCGRRLARALPREARTKSRRWLACRYKTVKGQRAVALCPLTTAWDQFSVSKLVRDLPCFVHLTIGALRDDSVAIEWPQDSRRHDPGLHEHIGVFDGDVVRQFIALTREFLHDVHVCRMEEASSPQPRRIDKRD